MLDDVATDLAVWIDETANAIALALAPTGRAPFAATVSEDEKLQYYRAQLFNPDGTPNMSGRTQEMRRLGPEGFTQVYKAVIKAYPTLKVPNPPQETLAEGSAAPAVMNTPPAPPSPVPPPSLPLEEYLFFGLQTVLVGLWARARLARVVPHE